MLGISPQVWALVIQSHFDRPGVAVVRLTTYIMLPHLLYSYPLPSRHRQYLSPFLVLLTLLTTRTASQDADLDPDPDPLPPPPSWATSPPSTSDNPPDSSTNTLTPPTSSAIPPSSVPTNTTNHPHTEEGGVLNYYFLLLFIFIIIICIVYYHVSRRRRAHMTRSQHLRTSALHQDLSWASRFHQNHGYRNRVYDHERQGSGQSNWTIGPRRYGYGRLRRWGGLGGSRDSGMRVGETEGLDERGEAPPPYVKEPERVHFGDDDGVGRRRSRSRSGSMESVELRDWQGRRTMGKPPDYEQARV